MSGSKMMTVIHCMADVGHRKIDARKVELIPYLITIGVFNGAGVADMYARLMDLRGMGQRRLVVGEDLSVEEYRRLMEQYQGVPVLNSYLSADQASDMLAAMLKHQVAAEQVVVGR